MKKLLTLIIVCMSVPLVAEVVDFSDLLTLTRGITPVTSTTAFNNLIKGNVLVEFYQPNCPPCSALSQRLNTLANNYPSVKIVKIDVRKHREFIKRFGIRSTPTTMIFVNGSHVARFTGVKSYSELEALVKQYLL